MNKKKLGMFVLAFITMFYSCKAFEIMQNNSDMDNGKNISQDLSHNSLQSSLQDSSQSEKNVELIVNLSAGTMPLEGKDEDFRRYIVPYNGEITAQGLAETLSNLMGLDFRINSAEIKGNIIIVDWAASSTLINGLGDTEQKEEFYFFDSHGLNWCMLDSLYYTILENIPVGEVYFTFNGGNGFKTSSDFPFGILPDDVPYMGSLFYVSHQDVRGD